MKNIRHRLHCLLNAKQSESVADSTIKFLQRLTSPLPKFSGLSHSRDVSRDLMLCLFTRKERPFKGALSSSEEVIAINPANTFATKVSG
jgi:hypothetical protein